MDDDFDSPVGPPKTVSRASFGCLTWGLLFIIIMAETAVFVPISAYLDVYMGSVVGGLGFVNLLAARIAADRILKSKGLSRSGKKVEVRVRTAAFCEGDVGEEEVVEIRYPLSFFKSLFWGSLLIFLFFAAFLLLLPPSESISRCSSYLMIAFFGFAAVWSFYGQRWGSPQARADSSGISGYPFGFHLRSKSIPWSRVATCEIETFYDTFGKPILIRPAIKGFNDETLMMMNLVYTRIEDQERLVKYIKAKLPKPKADALEW